MRNKNFTLKHCELEYVYQLHINCPVCDKHDWCSVYTYDGEIYAALCHRVDSTHETPTGGHIHFLKDFPLDAQPRRTFVGTPKKQRAAPEVLNDVYSRLFHHFSLTKTHQKNLIARGLTPAEVASLGYKSMPATLQRAKIVNELASTYGQTLLGVPGFYLTQRKNLWLASAEGMIIPSRNVRGKFNGAQIRVDDMSGGRKYRWLSAGKKQRKRGGVSSGTPIHVAGRDSDATRVWITEGLLKADIAALKIGETVIGIGGVGSYDEREMRNTLLTLKPSSVVIAFDADMLSNKNVQKQMKRLAALISALNIKVSIAIWEIEKGKGIDDLLVAGLKPSIEPFRTAPNLDLLKASPHLDGEKRIRRIVNPQISQPHPAAHDVGLESPIFDNGYPPGDVFKSREQMRRRIISFIESSLNGEVLLVRGTQGLGKSTNALEILASYWQKNRIRPIYAAPRHDLIDAMIAPLNELANDEPGLKWVHLRPRKPRGEDLQQLSPQAGYLHLKASLDQVPFSFENVEILCHHFKKADQLGSRRFNVPKNLCVQSCEIGTGLLGTSGCPYFEQYKVFAPIATVHQTLFIPKFCDDIFDADRLEFRGIEKHVVIIDEPNPATFIETVDITTSELSKAIVEAWSDGLVELLELLRQVAESVARDEDRKTLIGIDAMEQIVSKAGGAEQFADMLQKANAESPRTHETVIVKLDSLLDIRPKSLKVLIDGQVHYLPKQIASVIDEKSIQVAKWYAVKEDLPIIGEIQVEDDRDIPLNFTTDLLQVLREDYKKWFKGEPYNSHLVITANTKVPTIRLNLRREIQIPKNVPILLLDGCGNAELLSKLLRRPIQTWSAPLPPDTEIIQTVDGGYGVTTLWNQKTKAPKRSFWRLWNQILSPFVQKHAEKTLIVTWKCIADYLRKMQEKGEIPPQLAIGHYGNTEGSNAYEDRRFNFLLGTPQSNSDSVIQAAHALFCDESPIDPEMIDTWKAYNYIDCNGNGYQACVKVYKDPRCEMIARIHRDDELVQAAHRTRPLLHEGKTIFLLTNLPVDDLPPTRLMTVAELSEELLGQPLKTKDGKVTKQEAQRIGQRVFYEEGTISHQSFKTALQQTFRNTTKEYINSGDDERLSQPSPAGGGKTPTHLPSDSTLERWLKELAIQQGWQRSKVTVERRSALQGGGATWIWVYHCGELDEFTARAEYGEEMDIDVYDEVIVEACPWTKADFQDFGTQAETDKNEQEHPPPP